MTFNFTYVSLTIFISIHKNYTLCSQFMNKFFIKNKYENQIRWKTLKLMKISKGESKC